MELLDDMRCYKRTGKTLANVLRECLMRSAAYGGLTLSEDDTANDEERQRVLAMIRNDEYDVDDYDTFLNDLAENKRYQYLSPYTKEDFVKGNVHTYRVKGYPIGFALKPQENGGVDIVSVHNNSNIKGIGDEMIESAKRLGGNMLDHFDGFLSDFYQRHGFEEYDKMAWDDTYAPADWDYENEGRPSVIMRRLKKD